MTRTLQPDSRIAHYRVVGPLGAGGMGEVYLARDEKLERNLALKVLPPELVRSEDRVRRFMLEARSASSLNHPNIVTIYEVGHAPVLDADGRDVGGEPVHYIAMELVGGKTLSDLIHSERTELRTLLGYLAQAAEGLAKAHTAGIVHRDLKPGNVMVTNDGYAKVLDFGLAKLTEREGEASDVTSAPTATGDLTAGGMVVGTVGYMAPEQVRGKSVDHRSDVFAFGCMLYEAATRKKPFTGESHIETLHQILHDQPAPIDEQDPSVPAELRRVVRRCLAKNPEQRAQSMKDVAIELREIVEEYDSLSASASSGSGVRAAPVGRKSPVRFAVPVVAALGILGIAFGIYSMLGRRGGSEPVRLPFESVRISSIVGYPDIQSAVLSRDGRYVAYVKTSGGQSSLYVRQVATGSDVEVLAPREEGIRGLGFSPDGDYIFFLQRDPETPNYSALFQVPSLGGSPRKRLFDVDSGVSFSPDGRQVAFLRGVPQNNRTDLLVAPLDSGDERVVASVAEPESVLMDVAPAWSPDGARIVLAVQDNRGGIRMTLTAFAVDDGKRQAIPATRPLVASNGMAWLGDGSGLVVVANSLDAITMQPHFVAWPSGATRRITTDLDTYVGISIADDGMLASLRISGTGDLWVASVDGSDDARQVTFGGNNSMGNLLAVEDGSIVITDTIDGQRRLVTMSADGSDRRTIPTGAGHAFGPAAIPGSAGLVFVRVGEDDSVSHVFRVDLDGGNLVQLTTGEGENSPSVSPDGSLVLFRRTDRRDEVWSVPLAGGEPKRFLENSIGDPLFSPDGRHVAYTVLRESDGRQRPFGVIASVSGDEAPHEVLLPPRATGPAWHPSGSGVTLVQPSGSGDNIWLLPLGSQDFVPITDFKEGRIRGYHWSEDGKHLIVGRLLGQTVNLWVVDADGRNARPITDFRSGFINQWTYLADQRHVAFVQGETRRDVVLIRETSDEHGS